ncbi:hypothetical protein Q7P35_007810 [Cladosporium inversicolor]
MKRPIQTDRKPGFLFVHHDGAGANRGKAERRVINSHVMKHYAAQAKDGRKNRTENTQMPLPRIMQFYLVDDDGEHPRLRLPPAVAANAFDPFDSLATEKQRDTALILSSLFEPIKHDTILFSWTDRYFRSLNGDYWDAAMGDATTYHVVGTMQLMVRQNKDFYFHKVQAYRHLRQSVARCCQAQDGTARATLLSIANLLYLTAHETNLEESVNHVLAMKNLLTKENNDGLSPTSWFTVMFGPLNLCTAFPFAHPTVPYYSHPDCQWQHLVPSVEANAQASLVTLLLPQSIASQTIHSLFRRLFELLPLVMEARHYEAIMGLFLDIKYNICVCVAEVYWNLPKPPASMADYQNPNAFSLFTPSRPEVALYQRMHEASNESRLGYLDEASASATYMLLTALHLKLWMLCTNKTRIQANAGAARLIDSIAEFASEPRCQALFAGHHDALLWIVAAGISYTRYSLREPFADHRLAVLARDLLRKCGVEDVGQLVGVMALFSGGGVWSADALWPVFEEVERIGADLNPYLSL